MSDKADGICGKATADGTPCQNPPGCAANHQGPKQATQPTAESKAALKNQAAAASAEDEPTPAERFHARVAALGDDWSEVEAAHPDFVPVGDKYEALGRYSTGAIEAYREHYPRELDHAVIDQSANDGAGDFVVDAASYAAAVNAYKPGATEALVQIHKLSTDWLNNRTDDELDALCDYAGQPHNRLLGRGDKIAMLDRSVPREAKIGTENKALQAWFAAGNRRYGPAGYSVQAEVLDLLKPSLYQEENKAPRFHRIDSDTLVKVAAHLPVAHLADRRRGGPPLRDLLALAAEHPDVTFSGELIPPQSPKEAVAVSIVHVPKSKMDLPVFAALAARPHTAAKDTNDGYVGIRFGANG